jgi:hypothetical protein
VIPGWVSMLGSSIFTGGREREEHFRCILVLWVQRTTFTIFIYLFGWLRKEGIDMLLNRESAKEGNLFGWIDISFDFSRLLQL